MEEWLLEELRRLLLPVERETVEVCRDLVEARLLLYLRDGPRPKKSGESDRWHPGDRSLLDEQFTTAWRRVHGEVPPGLVDVAAIEVLSDDVIDAFAGFLVHNYGVAEEPTESLLEILTMVLSGVVVDAWSDYGAVLRQEDASISPFDVIRSLPYLVERTVMLAATPVRQHLVSEIVDAYTRKYGVQTEAMRRLVRRPARNEEFFEKAFHRPAYEDLREAARWLIGDLILQGRLLPSLFRSQPDDVHVGDSGRRWWQNLPSPAGGALEVERVERRWRMWTRYCTDGEFRFKGPWPFLRDELLVALGCPDFPSKVAGEMHDAAIWHLSPHGTPRWYHWADQENNAFMFGIAQASFLGWAPVKKMMTDQTGLDRNVIQSVAGEAVRQSVLSYDAYRGRRGLDETLTAHGWVGDLDDLSAAGIDPKSDEASQYRDRVVRPSVRTLRLFRRLLDQSGAQTKSTSAPKDPLDYVDLQDRVIPIEEEHRWADHENADSESPRSEPLPDRCDVEGVGRCLFLPSVADLIGISPRTLQRWIHKGFVRAPIDFFAPSSGKSYKVLPVEYVSENLFDFQLRAANRGKLATMVDRSPRSVKRMLEQISKEFPGTDSVERKRILVRKVRRDPGMS